MKTGDSFNLNLLPSQAKFQATRMKLQAALRRYMVIAAALWVLVIIITVILNIITSASLAAENKKYQQAFNGFKGMTDEIVISQLVKYRIKVVGKVLADRFEYSTAFEKIASIFSEKARMVKFEVDINRDFKVTVGASSKESTEFIENKVKAANEGYVEGVKSITINDVTYTNGEWLFNMGVILKK